MNADEVGVPSPSGVTVQLIHGNPIVDRAAEIYQEMLAEAGVKGSATAQPPQGRAPWRTTFHVAVGPDGTALGALHATLGNLDDLSLSHLVDPDQRLAAPICEAAAIAVLPEATGLGVTELLYRSVYCFARRHGALSLTALLDPLTLELFQDDYGISFRALGPVASHIGLELVAAGGELHELEEGARRSRPEFFAFLTEPFTAAEKTRFGL